MSFKVIFFGTPAFAVPCLQALLDSSHQVVAVYTQPDRPAGRGQKSCASPVKVLAESHHLVIYQPESLREPSVQSQLAALNADVFIVVAYGLLIPQSILNLTRYGALNVHPSLLPRWRGATPIQSAILAGDATTGVSVIRLTSKMDAGPILYQSSCPMQGQTSGRMHDILAQQGAQDLLLTLDLLGANRAPAKIQNEADATYTRKINKEDAKIDWRKSARLLEREIRAYNPWPVAYTDFFGKNLRIWEAQAVTDFHTNNPGSVLYSDNRHLIIATGEGGLSLVTVQLAGGRAVSVAEFIQGQRQHIHQDAQLFTDIPSPARGG